MPDEAVKKEIEILSKKELDRTIKRLASQILEKIENISSFCLLEYKAEEFICINY